MNFTTSHTLHIADPETGDPTEIMFTAHWTMLGKDSYYGPYFDLDYCQPINTPFHMSAHHYRLMEEIANDDPPDNELIDLVYDDWNYHDKREDDSSYFYPRDED